MGLVDRKRCTSPASARATACATVDPELACFYEPRQRLQTGVIRLDEDPSESQNAPTPIEFLRGHPCAFQTIVIRGERADG